MVEVNNYYYGLKETSNDIASRKAEYLSALVLFFLALPFLLPESIPELLPEFSKFVVLPWKAGALGIATIFVLLSGKVDKWIVLALLYCIANLIPVGLNFGAIASGLRVQLTTIALVLIFSYSVNARILVPFLRILRFFFLGEICLNLATVILFPEGLYVTDVAYYNPYHWLLGFDNIHVLTFLLAIGVSAVIDYFDTGLSRISFTTWLIYFLSLITVVAFWSATSIMVLAFVGVAFFARRPLEKIRLFNPKVVLVVFVACSVLLVTGVLLSVFLGGAEFLFSESGKAATISSRSVIWGLAIDAVDGNWLFGLGWEDPSTTVERLTITHAHNQLLQDFYTGGIVKALLLISLLVCVCQSLAQIGRGKLYVVMLTILCAFLIRWLVESMNMDIQLAFLTIIYYMPRWVTASSGKKDR